MFHKCLCDKNEELVFCPKGHFVKTEKNKNKTAIAVITRALHATTTRTTKSYGIVNYLGTLLTNVAPVSYAGIRSV